MKHLLYGVLVFLFIFSSNIEASENKNIYRINPGDEVEISVWKDESLSRQLTVPPDGVISFPLIGDIDANDLSYDKGYRDFQEQVIFHRGVQKRPAVPFQRAGSVLLRHLQ